MCVLCVVVILASRSSTTRLRGDDFGAQLTAAQDEICRVVRVRSIEVSSNEAPTFALPYGGSLSGPSTSSAGVVELPLCPVCLERLDANASGLVTIYCQHTLYILSAEALLTAQSLPLP